jgi:hypothetical protein
MIHWKALCQSKPIVLIFCLLRPSDNFTTIKSRYCEKKAFHFPRSVSYIYGYAHLSIIQGRLCGLVVRVPGYRSRGPEFDSRPYQIFWEVVSLKRGPLSLVSTTEELLGRNSGGSGLENREYGRGDPLRWPRDTLYPQNLALADKRRSLCRYSSLAD